MTPRAKVLPLAHLGPVDENLRALYEGECPRCGESIKADLSPGKLCIPPPTIGTTHQCERPPVDFRLAYVGSKMGLSQ